MLWQFVAILCGCGLIGVALWLSSKNGSKSAQLEALKSEIKKQAEEQARANKIIADINNRSADDARERLQNISGK